MEILEFEFFQRALVILVLASIVSGIVGSLIVIKKISMVSGSIAHGAFGGLGIAHYLGFNPLAGALIFSLGGSIFISFVSKVYKNFLDSILTIFWSGGMAIGIIFVFLTPGYATDLFSYLFGNILLTSWSDLYFFIAITLFVIVSFWLLRETLVATLFNDDFAKLKGVNTKFLFSYFLVMVAVTVVMLIKTMGIVLTLAILTIIPSVVVRLSNNVLEVIWISIVLNVITTILGLFASYYLDLPTAPVIVLVQVVVFVFALSMKR